MPELFRSRVITCRVCGTLKRVARSDAQFCSGKCRMRYMRKCDAITRGAVIAADAKGGAHITIPPVTVHPSQSACGGLTVTSPRPVVTGRPADPSRKPAIAGKPSHKPPPPKKSAAKVAARKKAIVARGGRKGRAK